MKTYRCYRHRLRIY